MNSLKRQAGKARRYEELKNELDSQLRTALTGRYYLLAREAARVAAELQQAALESQRLQAEVEAGEKELAAARERGYQTEAELTEARKRLAEVRVEIERTRGLIDSQARQVAGIEQRLQDGETETGQLSERLQALEQEREHFDVSFAEIHAAAEQARERLQAKTADRDTLQNQLRERERDLESSRQQVVRLLGEVSGLRNQLGQIDAYLASIDRDTARVRKDEESASAELQTLEVSRTEFGERLAARQLALESLAERRARIDAESQEKRQAVQQTRRDLDALNSETQGLRARRDSLAQILQHRSYANTSVKRLFTAIEQNQAQGLKPVGVLADFIELKDRASSAPPKSSSTKSWNTSSCATGARPSVASSFCGPNSTAVPPSWSNPILRTISPMFTSRPSPSRPSVLKPASPVACAKAFDSPTGSPMPRRVAAAPRALLSRRVARLCRAIGVSIPGFVFPPRRRSLLPRPRRDGRQ